LRSAAQPRQQLAGRLAAGVPVTLEKRRQALLAQATRIDRCGIPLQERQRDAGVDRPEHLGSTGPEAI
jgi:hypothetical protein